MTVPSPCVKLCALDPESRFCLGCGRLIEEIGGWSTLDDARRLRAVEAAGERLRAVGAAGGPAPRGRR